MIVFEKVTNDDIGNISKLEAESFSDPWTAQMFTEILCQPFYRFFKVQDENVLIGYICYYIVVGIEAHIAVVCINEKYRRKGLGQQLLYYATKECEKENIHDMTLEVRQSNVAAIRLYERVGFKSVGVRPKYYSDGENAVIMWLKNK